MKEVAEAAGVSQSTVSRVLAGADSRVPIAAETRSRILAAAHESGYRPNPLARGLRGASTHLIGAIVREIADPFFASILECLIDYARGSGYNVVLGHAHSSAAEAFNLETVLELRHCDGLILVGDLQDSLTVDLNRTALPLVGLCQGQRLLGIPVINADNRVGSFAALDYLHRLGHRRIAFIDGGWLGDIAERGQAYFDFMKSNDLPVLDGYQQSTTNDPTGGASALRSLLALTPRPTAIFAATDALAIGVYHAAWSQGLRIPSDLSVVGFDDVKIAQFTNPPLTTVRQPIEKMAALAVQHLLPETEASVTSVQTIQYVIPELMIRQSCCAHPQGDTC